MAPDYSTYVKEDELYNDPEVYLRMFCLWSRTFKELLNVIVCIVVISLYIDTRSSKLMKYLRGSCYYYAQTSSRSYHKPEFPGVPFLIPLGSR